MNVLEKITAERAQDAERARQSVPSAQLVREASARRHRSLADGLRGRNGIAVVAEVKKASPSAGLIRPEYDPAGVAREYEVAGAVGISVLTEPRHFQGGEADLRAVRSAVNLPILRKDFLSDPYQVLEAAAWGADVILIIVAALSPTKVRELYAAALDQGLEVLAEVHTAGELEVAVELERAILGVNSRDLKTLVTDLRVAEELAARMPQGRLCIAESGIRNREDIERLDRAGYHGYLIGETLLKAARPGRKLSELRGIPA